MVIRFTKKGPEDYEVTTSMNGADRLPLPTFLVLMQAWAERLLNAAEQIFDEEGLDDEDSFPPTITAQRLMDVVTAKPVEDELG